MWAQASGGGDKRCWTLWPVACCRAGWVLMNSKTWLVLTHTTDSHNEEKPMIRHNVQSQVLQNSRSHTHSCVYIYEAWPPSYKPVFIRFFFYYYITNAAFTFAFTFDILCHRLTFWAEGRFPKFSHVWLRWISCWTPINRHGNGVVQRAAIYFPP